MNRDDTTTIARMVARVVLPIILVTAVALLLQGHNLPGGGFIAGVLTAGGIALLYIIYDLEFLEEEVLHRRPEVTDITPSIVDDYRALFASGLALAAGSGIVAMAFGHPFLAQTFEKFHHLPIFGEIELATALAFDVGVYLVVVGGLLTIVGVVGGE